MLALSDIEGGKGCFFYSKCYTFLMSAKNWKPIGTTIGGLLLDLGKLSFGGLLLGSILRGGLNPFNTFLLGGGLAIGFFIGGIIVIAINKE